MSSDAFSVRAVIVILGVIAVGGAATICYLAAHGQEIPALLSTLVLGVIALLSPSPLTKAKTAEAQDVNVKNTAAEPIPVDAKHVDTGGL